MSDEYWNAVCIVLTKGQHAVIDIVDFERVIALRWFTQRGETKIYGARSIYNPATRRSKFLYLHNFLWGDVPDGMMVDHRDGDGLNNRKSNFRLATKSQNTASSRKRLAVGGRKTSSRYRGVSWDKSCKRWFAALRVNYKRISLGYFIEEEDAAMAYNEGATEHFGEFAALNLAEAA